MSMLRICAAPGCETRSLGQFCLTHEESSLSHRPSLRQMRLRLLPPEPGEGLLAGARDMPREDPSGDWLESA